MFIIAGHLRVDIADRDAYVADCRTVCEQARRAPGCLDYTVAADPLEPDRVNVYELWATGETLTQFRGSGPEDQLSRRVRDAQVHRYQISDVEAP